MEMDLPKSPLFKVVKRLSPLRKNQTLVTLINKNQIEHVNVLKSILNKNWFAFDLSMMGTGKTYTSSSIYQSGDYTKLIVIAPTTILNSWITVSEKHGFIDDLIPLSFTAVRSDSKNNILLKSRSYFDDCGKKHTTFTPTAQLKSWLKQGALVIVDEIQNIKNDTLQAKSCRRVFEEIFKNEKSRLLLLSASPIDKYENTINVFKNILVVDESVNKDVLEYVVEYVRQFEPLYSPKFNTKEIQIYNCFVDVVIPFLSHSMVPFASQFSVLKYNGFYKMDQATLDMIKQLVSSIVARIIGGKTISNLSTQLRAIELLKTSLFVRLIRSKLKERNKKVVMCCNYLETVNVLKEELSGFSPLVLTGSVPRVERTKIINKFQAPNLNHRLLIGISQVCSTGIDLDDQDGNFPRVCFASPNYYTINLYQLGHRFHRNLTKSDSEIYLVFASSRVEIRIIELLKLKGDVMKQTTKVQAENNVIFPSDHVDFVE